MSTSVPFVDLSIVVPAYNEEHRIAPTLARLSAFLVNQPMRWEIVVVDDGSRDATCAVVQAAMARIPNLRLVRQTPNRGKGAAVRLGMLEARGQIDGWAFDLEILALARRAGYEIAEVGVEWTDDRRSRVNPLKDLWKVVREAMTIRKNLRTGVYRKPARALPSVTGIDVAGYRSVS